MPSNQLKLLEERLNSLVDRAVERALIDVNQVHSQATLAGSASSSRRILLENTALYERFDKEASSVARTIFHAVGDGPEASALLTATLDALTSRLTEHMEKARANTEDSLANTAAKMQRELAERLAEESQNTRIDFGFGVVGGETMKKSGDTNVSNININSPGSSQQAVGQAGHVTQNVSQAYAELSATLDQLNESPELRALGDDDQAEVRELIDDVRNEVCKDLPDAGRVRRFAGYLKDKLGTLGLTTAATTISTIIAGLVLGG